MELDAESAQINYNFRQNLKTLDDFVGFVVRDGRFMC